MKHLYFYFFLFLATCTHVSGQEKNYNRPNILWITCEDMSLHLGSYGNLQVKTPNLDKLAAEGIRYTHVFATAGVCAPSRSAIITGMYQQSIGTQHMRTPKYGTGNDAYPPNYVGYAAVIPQQVKCFPEYLRAAGYYCTNNVKEDYQFDAPPTVWDESSKTAHWRNRPDPDQPFFSIFNFTVTHESQVWARANEPLLVNPKEVQVPPYYPDVPEVRLDIARHFSNVMVMDQQAGEILAQLKEDGLEDNTVIFFYSDHGDGLPFAKRELYDRGTQVPMIIKFGKNLNTLNPFPGKQGVVDDQLVSFVDLAPTALSLAGCKLPTYFQGQAFLGPAKAKPRKYIFAARDRMDSEYDRVRCIRDKQFLYLRNYMPEKPYYQNIKYRLQQPMMRKILEMKKAGQLNETQMLWFRPTKPPEELYDCVADPYQLKNIVDDPRYKAKLEELRTAYNDWIKETGDLSEVPESKMVKDWWGGADSPPATAQPDYRQRGETVTVDCKTAGASIGYKFKADEAWKVYQAPVNIHGKDSLYLISQRIGYTKSKPVSIALKK